MEFDCNAVVITPLLCHVPWNIRRQGLLLRGYHMNIQTAHHFLEDTAGRQLVERQLFKYQKYLAVQSFTYFSHLNTLQSWFMNDLL